MTFISAVFFFVVLLFCSLCHGVTDSPLELIGARCPLKIHGYSVQAVLLNPRWSSLARDLDLADFWGGAGAITSAASAAGLNAAIFDWEHNARMDFFSEEGFCQAVDLAMRLRPGGCLAMGPTCSSFGFGPTSVTGRKASNFGGSPDCEAVRRGNFEAEVACFFLFLAVARGVHAWIEQPAGSMMFSYLDGALKLLPFLVSICTPRCFYSREPLGKRFFKKYKFLATGDWIVQIAADCPCGKRGHQPLMSTDADGKKTGIRSSMRESQVYPADLGIALVQAWQSAEGTGSPEVEEPELHSGQLPGHWLVPAAITEPEPELPATRIRGKLREAVPKHSPGPWAENEHEPCKRQKGTSTSHSAGPWAAADESDVEQAFCQDSEGPWGTPVQVGVQRQPAGPW